jgi:hypothetical protein
MAFSPFARYRNFTVDNLKALLEVYPDQAEKLTWSEAGDIIESVSSGYKRTSYQQACQFGLEDRGREYFRVQSYLYTFEEDNLLKYIEFWIKTYYAPNPYVNSDDAPMLIYCELVREILAAQNLCVEYYDFFNRRIGGKSDDMLMNALKSYCAPLKYKMEGGKHYFYVEQQNAEYLEKQVDFIEKEFPIPSDVKSRKEFFDRYKYVNFCKFHGITSELPEEVDLSNENQIAKRLTGGENILLYGVPGAGKSHTIAQRYCADQRRIERVVFHPDYTYSDFVGQILPRVINGELKYVFTPGPFTRMVEKAWKDPKNHYYLIIEEINRGNAPAIFGEIFQLLDRKDIDHYPEDVVGESEYGISNYEVAEIVYGNADHEVKLPSNMFVLATMNTADQNVFTLDTAFQRRWKMEHIPNKFVFEEGSHALDEIQGTNLNWGVFATVINNQITEISRDIGTSEDKRLGTYFVKKNELTPDVFPEKVLKYLWDDAFKMDKEAVFDSRFASLEEVIETYETSPSDKLQSVLRDELYAKMEKKMKEKPMQQSGEDTDK